MESKPDWNACGGDGELARAKQRAKADLVHYFENFHDLEWDDERDGPLVIAPVMMLSDELLAWAKKERPNLLMNALRKHKTPKEMIAIILDCDLQNGQFDDDLLGCIWECREELIAWAKG
jgi:hypothetical protein